MLRERAERAEREREILRRENERLRQQVDHLKRQLDAARRAGYRQAAPFAKPLNRHPKRAGRKPGDAYGRPARRRVPSHIEEPHDARLPARGPGCGDRVVETGVAMQYQEALPVPRVVVRAFRVRIGRCRGCGRRVQGRHALQTSDALGAAAAQLGPQAVAFAVILNTQLGLSYGKIATLFQQQSRLTVTRGGLVQAVQRAARHAQPTYAALCTTGRGSPMVSPDETGWKVGGQLQWLWAFATPDTTVYRIQPGRGFDEAAAVLGADFAGVLVRDGWAPYRRFTAAAHQTCLAHLLRRLSVSGDFPTHVNAARLWDGTVLPDGIKNRLTRVWAQLAFLNAQLEELEDARAALTTDPHTAAGRCVEQLQALRGVGSIGAWLLTTEIFAWRQIHNGRELGALVGLVPAPYQSGDTSHDRGITRAGNRHVRRVMVQLAWSWLRYQPASALSRWYHQRFGSGRRMRRIGIVALARKLLIAFWRYLETGAVPEGAVMKPHAV